MRRWPPLGCLLALGSAAPGPAGEPEARRQQCLVDAFPQTRSDFPALLNCLGLVQEAVEVGVQAGVHASSFLEGWQGRRLRLVDKWSDSDDGPASQLFYVDIANIHGADVREQHRSHCEARLAGALRAGRAEIVSLDSGRAASGLRDGELDFVYLDARHDFSGVAADILAWWPKVRTGGVFAGHDFVDGEFPEGDFFWISALREVLPGLEGHVQVTREKDRYPSFFLVKTPALAGLIPRAIPSEALARQLYARRSRYFTLWRGLVQGAGVSSFLPVCRNTCGHDCEGRARAFTPTRSAGSTLRPFACVPGADHEGAADAFDGAPGDACGSEMVVDVKAYHDVCLERCNVTCQQRNELFSLFGAEILSSDQLPV